MSTVDSHCAKSVSPDVAIRINAAKEHMDAGRVDEALAQLHDALAIAPQNSLLLAELGRALLITGSFEEAEVYLSRAMALDPITPGLALSYSRCQRFHTDSSPHLEMLRNLANREDLDPLILADIHFALGKINDDLKRFDEAFAHFKTANTIMSGYVTYDNAKVHRSVKALKEVYTPAFFRSIPPVESPTCSPLFIVGMPRSGTTLVEQILGAHPAITTGDELPFLDEVSVEFAQRLGGRYPQVMRRLTRSYAEKMAKTYCQRAHQRLGSTDRFTDKMPTNFFHIGLVATLFPGAAIIHCRRNPADVALSNYFQQFGEGNDWAYDLKDTSNFYRHYLNMMAHWHHVLPERILDVDYEALVADPKAWRERLFVHCDLATDEASSEPHKVKRPVLTSSNWQVRQPIYQHATERWRNYAVHVESVLAPLLGD